MASRSLGALTLDLIANIGGFTSGMDKAEREATRRSKRIQSSLAGIGKAVTAAFAVVGAGTLVRSIINATAEAEKSFALLSNAVEASGGAAGYTAAQLADMAGELQKTTTYSDEAVQGAEQLLLRFQSIQGLNFKEALASTLDLATALGKDLPEAALLVGKALENPAKGLTQLQRAGVVLSDTQANLVKRLTETGNKAEAQGILLDELKKRYGGAAEAARNNFSGALAGLKNSFEDLLEAKGGLPDAVEQLNKLSATLQDPNFKQGIEHLTTGIIRLVGVVAEGAGELGQFGEVLARMAAGATGNLAEIDKLEGDLTDLTRAINNSFLGKPLKYIATNTEDLKRMRAEVEAQIAALKQAQNLTGAPNTPGATPATPTIAPPSEEFLKLEAHLKEQIALYGKTGEAAKLSYQIQSGGLEELSKTEQQELLALAKAYDALGDIVGHVFTQMERDQMAVGEGWKEIRLGVDQAIKDSQVAQDDLAAALAPDFEKMLDENLDTYKESVDKQNEYQLEAARNTQDILAQGFEDAMDGSFDNILKSFAQMIEKMVAQSLAADVAGKLFGKEGTGGGWVDKGLDWLGGLFGGGRASGGPVNSGHLYQVNEQGMEAVSIPGQADYLMMGGRSGNVTPASSVAGHSTINQVINVTGAVNQYTARQLAQKSIQQQRLVMRFA